MERLFSFNTDKLKYICKIVNPRGKTIGARFVWENNRLKLENLYLDVPSKYLISSIHDYPLFLNTNEINAIIDEMRFNEKTLDFHVFNYSWLSLPLSFDNEDEGSPITENDDFSLINKTNEIISVILPVGILRYEGYGSVDRTVYNLKNVFNIIYGTDFIDRFEIDGVNYVGFIGSNEVFCRCTSRKFKSNCDIDTEKEFLETLKDFYKINKTTVNINLSRSGSMYKNGFDIIVNISSDALPMADAGLKNEIPSFDLYVEDDCYKSHYIRDRFKYIVDETVYPDNPFGIKINVNETIDSVDSRINLIDLNNVKQDIFKNLIYIGNNTFVATVRTMPHVDESITNDVLKKLDEIFSSDDLEAYRESLISLKKDYFIMIDSMGGLVYRVKVVSKIDPNAFGEENVDFLLETTMESFIELAEREGGECRIIDNETIEFCMDCIVGE